jgi:hypothetical protein
LRPEPYIDLLTLSYIAIFATLTIGFLLFIKKLASTRRPGSHEQFLTYSTVALLAIFLIYEFKLSLQPLRVLWFAAPFIALFTALLYDRLFAEKRVIWRVIAASVLTIVVFTAFLAPWSRGYMPIYVYEPSVTLQDFGQHNPQYRNVLPFARDHLQNESFERILSDDDVLLYIIFPTESYSRIRNLHSNPEMINGTNIILFEFMSLQPSFHNLPYIEQQHPEIVENLENFKDQISLNFNTVYDDGSSRILKR